MTMKPMLLWITGAILVGGSQPVMAMDTPRATKIFIGVYQYCGWGRTGGVPKTRIAEACAQHDADYAALEKKFRVKDAFFSPCITKEADLKLVRALTIIVLDPAVSLNDRFGATMVIATWEYIQYLRFGRLELTGNEINQAIAKVFPRRKRMCYR